MSLNFFFAFLLAAGITTAKSQVLLNADSAQIRNKIIAQGGVYKGSKLQNDIEATGYYQEMEFQFPKSTTKMNGIVEMTFFLDLKNSCFKYSIAYYGYYYKKQLIEKFNKSSGLKQIDSLNWVNTEEKYKVGILRNVPFGREDIAIVYFRDRKEVVFPQFRRECVARGCVAVHSCPAGQVTGHPDRTFF